jgi:hypothetical protein
METEFSEFEHLKTPFMTYWNLHGPKVNRYTLTLFGIPESYKDEVLEWLIEWYGGEKSLNEKLKKYNNKLFSADALNMGSYSFNFVITNIRLEETYITFNALVDGSGEISVTDDDDNQYHNIYDAYNADIMGWGWEVKDEVKDIVNETVEKILDLAFESYCDDLKILKNFKNKFTKT